MKSGQQSTLKSYKKAMGVTFVLLCLFVAAIPGYTQQSDQEKNLFDGQIAPLLDGMGNHHFEISTDNELAQKFFNQGLALSYGFNHKEAGRAFRQVTMIDPENPMGWWGVALVLGPNINSTMPEDNVPVAYEALQKAQALKENGTQKEQDYIHALSYRYAENPTEDRTSLDLAYAQAMGWLAKKYPDDPDAQTLYAEALMDLHPWDYWVKMDGEIQPWTHEIIAILETVIERNPNHPGANHLYIHAVESGAPHKALTSADRLGDLVPGAGHLVHMPSHIYIRTGNYHKGTVANERAVKADNMYVTQCRQQGIYPLGYVPHNYHFLWATATMEGRSQLSMEAAQNTSDLVDTQTMRLPGLGTLQHYWVLPLYDHVRFGRWDEILEYEEPAQDLIYPRGIWHYARGMAYVGKDQLAEARTELQELVAIVNHDALKEITIWDINSTHELMTIAALVLEGEIKSGEGNYEAAENNLRKAIEIEDQLKYNEPPDWFFPVRHNLGAVLLDAGKAEAAEQIYRNDLKNFPNNGWSLFGLHQALKAQGKKTEAANIKQQFEEAWSYSDIELSRSRVL